MRWLMLAVPAILFIEFIPFGIVMEEIFDTGLFFFITMVLYVILFPLSPVIVGAILYGKGEHPAIGPITGATSFSYTPEANNETDKPELAEWWKPDMTENDGYQ